MTQQGWILTPRARCKRYARANDARGIGTIHGFFASSDASGALVRVLEDWCPPLAACFLYYSSRRQQPAALAAPADTLRLAQRSSRRKG